MCFLFCCSFIFLFSQGFPFLSRITHVSLFSFLFFLIASLTCFFIFFLFLFVIHFHTPSIALFAIFLSLISFLHAFSSILFSSFSHYPFPFHILINFYTPNIVLFPIPSLLAFYHKHFSPIFFPLLPFRHYLFLFLSTNRSVPASSSATNTRSYAY